MSEKMERPRCEWRNGENCKRPATWAVIFVDDYRTHFSCEGHADQWNKHGRGCYLCEIKGYLPQTTIKEIFKENQQHELSRAGKKGKAAGLRAREISERLSRKK